MKYIIVNATIIGCLAWSVMAQRPSYAGSGPIGRPELANRFRDPNPTSTTSTANLSNRVGEDVSTIRTPVDARGDQELVNRLNEWPREHRPFWLLNAEAIEASRNQNTQQQQQQEEAQQNLQNRGSFQRNLQNSQNVPETLPIRPTNHRSSFLSPIN